MPQDPPIRVQALRKTFGTQTVLNGIDLEVARGETLSILGRSGTGKSVLLKLLIGLLRPDAGSITVHGQQVPTLPPETLNEIRKKIGFMFQQAALYDSLTVEQNVIFPLARHTALSSADRTARARQLLSTVGMDEHRHKLPSQISGGMQKRVALARALALGPDILLSDEPTSGLDPITATEIGNLILSLKKERQMTAIVVTHDLHSARLFSDRFLLMHEGVIQAQGAYDDLRQSASPFVVQFLAGAS